MFTLKTKLNMLRGVITRNRPFYIQYYILSRCNLNCRQCNIVEGNSDLKDADLPEIEKIFLDQGLTPRLQTAGFQTTREQLEACARVGAKDINISLDSLVPEKQEYINGSIAKSWHRAIEAIVTANDVFGDPDRICAFGTVLSKFNYMEIPAIIELATFMGWYESLVPVHITMHE